MSFKAWLFKIAHNECINKIRERRWDTHETNDDYLENLPCDENTHEDISTALSALMADLSFIDRNIMLLRYRTELDFQEVADICNLKLPAVKICHKRVIEFLTGQLKA